MVYKPACHTESSQLPTKSIVLHINCGQSTMPDLNMRSAKKCFGSSHISFMCVCSPTYTKQNQFNQQIDLVLRSPQTLCPLPVHTIKTTNCSLIISLKPHQCMSSRHEFHWSMATTNLNGGMWVSITCSWNLKLYYGSTELIDSRVNKSEFPLNTVTEQATEGQCCNQTNRHS